MGRSIEQKEEELAKIAQNKQSKVNRPKYKCHHRKCKKREWIKIECNLCHQTFCLKHRSPDDHVCKPRVMQSAASCSKQAQMDQNSRSMFIFLLFHAALGSSQAFIRSFNVWIF